MESPSLTGLSFAYKSILDPSPKATVKQSLEKDSKVKRVRGITLHAGVHQKDSSLSLPGQGLVYSHLFLGEKS